MLLKWDIMMFIACCCLFLLMMLIAIYADENLKASSRDSSLLPSCPPPLFSHALLLSCSPSSRHLRLLSP